MPVGPEASLKGWSADTPCHVLTVIAELMNAIWHGSLSWPEKRSALALVLANHADSPTIHRQLLIWLEVASRAEYATNALSCVL